MYIKIGELIYKILRQNEDGAWIIDVDHSYKLQYISAEVLSIYDKVPEPEFIQNNRNNFENHVLTDAQIRRYQLIESLLKNEGSEIDAKILRNQCADIAEQHGTTTSRVERIYRKFVATYSLANNSRVIKPKPCKDDYNEDFLWAIRTIYFSPHRVSLQDAYNIMLLKKYTIDGELVKDAPSFWTFRKFYYSRGLHKKSSRLISRNGLTDFLQNERLLYGSASKWRDKIGSYQMDSTIADIVLVSRFDKKEVVGRPSIYLAVDTATQLIAGVYVGFETGCAGTLACLCNTVYDKVEFCKQYGIEIEKWQWPCAELPGEIITDKGTEFLGNDVTELCAHFGVVCHSMPPFRPDRKGLVEMSFDMLQRRYKNVLRGKGVVEKNLGERWAPDYNKQAILDIEEFTKIILHCIIYLNSARALGKQFMTKEIVENDVEVNAAKLWIWYKQNHQDNLIHVNKEDLYKFTLSRKKATIQRQGIQLQGLWYCSPMIESAGLHIGDKVDIAFDENDISNIFVIRDREFVKIPLSESVNQFIGLTQKEFQQIRKKQAITAKKRNKYEIDARMKMIANIDSIVKQAEDKKDP